mgnify:CR=1 FL=1
MTVSAKRRRGRGDARPPYRTASVVVRDGGGVRAVEYPTDAEVAVRRPYSRPYLLLDDYTTCIAPAPGISSKWICVDASRGVVATSSDVLGILLWHYGAVKKVEVDGDAIMVETSDGEIKELGERI